MKKKEHVSNSSDSAVAPSRRKFLTRTTAGVVVASIPAKSVLANNIVNSIIASGNASDFAGGDPIQLLGPCQWLGLKSYWTSVKDEKFNVIFGEGPSASLKDLLNCFCCPEPASHDDNGNDDHNGNDHHSGNDDDDSACGDDDASGVNYDHAQYMIAMYLNAIVDFNNRDAGPSGLFYPIIKVPEDINNYIESLRQNRSSLSGLISEFGGDINPSTSCSITDDNGD
ncbi:MAG: hypothetical protein COB35_11780 [Gammaproteobacteria bacterium]|nr:MAG: hypothetical protein COB35_11780 [Gammaproteobacteria bacterium]